MDTSGNSDSAKPVHCFYCEIPRSKSEKLRFPEVPGFDQPVANARDDFGVAAAADRQPERIVRLQAMEFGIEGRVDRRIRGGIRQEIYLTPQVGIDRSGVARIPHHGEASVDESLRSTF